MKKLTLDSFTMGTLLGLLLPQFFILLSWLYEFNFLSFIPGFYKFMILRKVLSPLISLCAFPNVALMFLLINRAYYKAGKGVILATIVYGFIILYLKIWVEHTLFFD